MTGRVDDGGRGATTEMPWYRGGGGDSALGDSVLSTDELLLSTDDTSDSASKRRRYSADDDDDDDDDDDVTPGHVTSEGADVTGYFRSLRTHCQRQSGTVDAASVHAAVFSRLSRFARMRPFHYCSLLSVY